MAKNTLVVSDSTGGAVRRVSDGAKALLDDGLDVLAPDPEGKSRVSSALLTLGALLLSFDVALGGTSPRWLTVCGGAFLVASWLVSNAASSQQRVQARAADLIAWKREEQLFRRTVQKLWERLKARHGDERFQELVEHAGTPEDRGDSAEELEHCLNLWMPRLHFDTPEIVGNTVALTDGERAALRSDFERAKDVLEIWSMALEVGGGRERALREVVQHLGGLHRPSVRLMWWLAKAHTEFKRVTDDPDYHFVTDVWEIMLSGSEGDAE